MILKQQTDITPGELWDQMDAAFAVPEKQPPVFVQPLAFPSRPDQRMVPLARVEITDAQIEQFFAGLLTKLDTLDQGVLFALRRLERALVMHEAQAADIDPDDKLRLRQHARRTAFLTQQIEAERRTHRIWLKGGGTWADHERQVERVERYNRALEAFPEDLKGRGRRLTLEEHREISREHHLYPLRRYAEAALRDDEAGMSWGCGYNAKQLELAKAQHAAGLELDVP